MVSVLSHLLEEAEADEGAGWCCRGWPASRRWRRDHPASSAGCGAPRPRRPALATGAGAASRSRHCRTPAPAAGRASAGHAAGRRGCLPAPLDSRPAAGRLAHPSTVPQDVDDPGTRSGIGPPSGVRARQSAPARLWLLAPAPSLAASGELQVVHTLALHETIATAAAQQQARRLAWRQGTGCAVRDEPHHGPLGLLTHVTPGAEGVLRGQHPRRVAGHNSPVYDAGAVSPVRARHYRPHPLPVPDGRARDRFHTWRRLGRQVGCGKHVSGSWRA